MIVPNPTARRPRRLWRGLALVSALVIAIAAVQLVLPPTARFAFRVLGTCVLVAACTEFFVSWQIGREAGSLKATAKQLRQDLPGPLVYGSTFAAWPTGRGHGGPLLDAAVNELHRDGVSLPVQARDDKLAETYLRHGAMSASSTEPLHLLWRAVRS